MRILLGFQVTDDTLRGHLLTKDNNDEKIDSPCTKDEHSVEIHFSYSPKVEKLRQDTASKGKGFFFFRIHNYLLKIIILFVMLNAFSVQL